MQGDSFVDVEAKPVSDLDGLADNLEGEVAKTPAEPSESAVQSDSPDGGGSSKGAKGPVPSALQKMRGEIEEGDDNEQ